MPMSIATSEVKTVAQPQVSETEVVFTLPLNAGNKPLKIDSRKVFHAAQDSAEFFDHLRAHYREARRTVVEISCEIRLVLADGTVFDSGTAVVKNVSPSGALIGAMKLEKGTIPITAFKVVLVLKEGEYNGIGIEATPVRLVAEVGGMGVKFDEIFVSV
jgi:hypothetical protein